MYIVAIAKIADSQILLLKLIICFALFYQLDPFVSQCNLVADNIKLIFSMSNVNIIVDIKLQPNKFFYSSNQTK